MPDGCRILGGFANFGGVPRDGPAGSDGAGTYSAGRVGEYRRMRGYQTQAVLFELNFSMR